MREASRVLVSLGSFAGKPHSCARRWLFTGACILSLFFASPVHAQLNNTPVAGTYVTDGIVYAIATTPTTVYIGGSFTQVGPAGGPFVARNGLASLDAATGIATSWAPNVEGEVRSLAILGSTLYVGGDFLVIDSQARFRIAAIDTTSGLVTSWSPMANNAVHALAISGTTLYAGGNFTVIGGQTRNYIAAFDTTTGTISSWNAMIGLTAGYNVVNALAISGATVYAGGVFSSVGGQSRDGIAALDAATGNVTAWNPNPTTEYNSIFSSLAVSGNTVYAGGGFYLDGEYCFLVAFDATTGAATSWNPNPNFDIGSMVISGPLLYVSGGFTTIGGQTRNHVAALDIATGAATVWNPSETDDVSISCFALSSTSLYVGGYFTSIGGQPNTCFAEFRMTDSTRPSVTINQKAAQADPANALPIAFDVLFSEDVTGFDATGVAQSGTATGVTFTVTGVDASHYTVNATAATTDGTIQPTIAAGVCTDLVGLANAASTSSDNTVTLDRVAPSIAIGAPNPAETANGPVTFALTYSEPCAIALAPADIQLGATGTATGEIAVSGAGNTSRTVTLQNITGAGTLWITAMPLADTDLAGNPVSASAPSLAVTVTAVPNVPVAGIAGLALLASLLSVTAVKRARKK